MPVKDFAWSALLLTLAIAAFPSNICPESRSAQDIAKECRVALDVFQKRIETNFENTLYAGECVGYVDAR